MELQPGWYKVKLEDEWTCMYYDGSSFVGIMPNRSPVWCLALGLDEIGDRIEFPND